MNNDLCMACGAYWDCDHKQPHLVSENLEGTNVHDLGPLPAWIDEPWVIDANTPGVFSRDAIFIWPPR